MAVLKIDVIVNDTDAEAKLDRIESKVKNVTQVSDQHRAAIDKIKDSYTNTFGAADTSAKATEKYTESLSKASTEAVKAASAVQTLGAAKAAQVAVISKSGAAFVEEQMSIFKTEAAMNNAAAAAAEMSTAQTTLASSISLTAIGAVGLGTYLGLAVSEGLLLTKVVYDSARAYAEHTGMLKALEAQVQSVQGTWHNAQIAIGGILLANQDDISGWTGIAKSLINEFAEYAMRKLLDVRIAMALVRGGAERAGLDLNGPPPVSDKGNAAAGLLMWQNRVSEAGRLPVTSADSATQQFEAGERERIRALKEAQRDAEQWKKVNDDISGRSAATDAQNWMRHLQQVGGITHLTSEATKELTRTLKEAILYYDRIGAIAPPAMLSTLNTLSPIKSYNEQFADLSKGLTKYRPHYELDEAKVVKPMSFDDRFRQLSTIVHDKVNTRIQLDDAQMPEGFFSKAFGSSDKLGSELSSLVMRAVRSGPMSAVSAGGSYIGQHLMTGLAQTITSGAGLAISGALGGAINAILPGLGSLIGPLLGKIGGLFGMGTAGRDAVKDFSQQITGSTDINALHALLAEKLPHDAERFWIALTQGVGRNNPQEAKRVIGEINDALSHAPLSMEGQASQAGFSTTAQTQQTAQEAVHLYEFMRDSGQYSASVVEAAWKRANDAMIASGDATAIAAQHAKDAVAGLTQQIDSLTQSIANEAPEEVMGVVEERTRAQIAVLEAQRAEITVNVHWNADPLPVPGGGSISFEEPEAEVPEMARGGVVRARRGGTLVRVGEAGQDEMITPLGGSGAGGGIAIIEIDGRMMAEITVPHIPGVVKRYGLA